MGSIFPIGRASFKGNTHTHKANSSKWPEKQIETAIYGPFDKITFNVGYSIALTSDIVSDWINDSVWLQIDGSSDALR